jgi:alginate O-acetyltransferase complex protein AlgJ
MTGLILRLRFILMWRSRCPKLDDSMKQITTIQTLTLVLLSSCGYAQEAADSSLAFAAKAKSVAETPLAGGKIGYKGAADGWFFLGQELRHLGLGEFWKGDFSDTAAKKDPRPIIEAYHKALKDRGVRLIVVPIPPKAAIYPEKFWSEGKDVFPTADFYKSLTDAGVEVIDLEPALRAEKEQEKLYCATDSHPSPYACKMIAGVVAEKLGEPKGAGFDVSEAKEVSVTGDMSSSEKETLKAWSVSKDGAAVSPVDKASPVVVVGDSHTLVFQAGGDMLLTGSGLVDHLQAALGYPVYLEANKGSGIDAARGKLARSAFSKPDFWEGKKAVVWCFGARMFTQEKMWRELPVGK